MCYLLLVSLRYSGYETQYELSLFDTVTFVVII